MVGVGMGLGVIILPYTLYHKFSFERLEYLSRTIYAVFIFTLVQNCLKNISHIPLISHILRSKILELFHESHIFFCYSTSFI